MGPWFPTNTVQRQTSWLHWTMNYNTNGNLIFLLFSLRKVDDSVQNENNEDSQRKWHAVDFFPLLKYWFKAVMMMGWVCWMWTIDFDLHFRCILLCIPGLAKTVFVDAYGRLDHRFHPVWKSSNTQHSIHDDLCWNVECIFWSQHFLDEAFWKTALYTWPLIGVLDWFHNLCEGFRSQCVAESEVLFL